MVENNQKEIDIWRLKLESDSCLCKNSKYSKRKNMNKDCCWRSKDLKSDGTNQESHAHCHGNCTAWHPCQTNKGQCPPASLVHQCNLEHRTGRSLFICVRACVCALVSEFPIFVFTHRHHCEDCVNDSNSYSGVDWLSNTSCRKDSRRVIKYLEDKTSIKI